MDQGRRGSGSPPPPYRREEALRVERYEWRIINQDLGLFGLWDKVKREYVIETTRAGMEAYKRMGL